MKTCGACGAAKPDEAIICPVCAQGDMEALRRLDGGSPSLTLLVFALVCLSIYRFWVVGWRAWSGNLRLAALCAIGLGLTAVVSGPLRTFGIGTRKTALVVAVVGGVAFLILNFV